MHPEFLREMTDLRGREMRARAHQARLAKLAIRIGRRRRSLPDEADRFVIPAIPDYVDGSFSPDPASTELVTDREASEAGQAPAAHRAA